MFILSVLPEFLRLQRYSLFAKPPSFFLFFYKRGRAIVAIFGFFKTLSLFPGGYQPEQLGAIAVKVFAEMVAHQFAGHVGGGIALVG